MKKFIPLLLLAVTMAYSQMDTCFRNDIVSFMAQYSPVTGPVRILSMNMLHGSKKWKSTAIVSGYGSSLDAPVRRQWKIWYDPASHVMQRKVIAENMWLPEKDL